MPNAGAATSRGADPVDPGRFRLEEITPPEERELLRQLVECRRELEGEAGGALAEGQRLGIVADAPGVSAHPAAHGVAGDGPDRSRLDAVRRRYIEVRSKLALGCLRLVYSEARRFRDRGVPYPDLVQEGFCGVLQALDRFDLSNGNRLSTYAMWWIRQAMQRTVAACAYPVRLNPQCLRKLALHRRRDRQQWSGRSGDGPSASEPVPEAVRQVHAAVRPAVSLDADREGDYRLIDLISDSDTEPTGPVDTDEILTWLMSTLRPRERQVVALRFGLGGRERHTLSRVGRLLGVSRERIRQIQEDALNKLRHLPPPRIGSIAARK